MKKVFILIVVLILALGGYFALKGKSSSSGGKNILSNGILGVGGEDIGAQKLLPENVLVYYQADDVKEGINKWTSSQIWKELKTVNWDLLLKNAKLNISQRIMWEKLVKQLKDEEFQKAFFKFFGKQFTIALYESEIDYTQFNEKAMQNMPALLEDAFAGLYVITRVGTDVQLAELVSRSFNSFGDDVVTEMLDYRGHSLVMVTFKESQMRLSYTRVKDLIVIGLGDHPTKRTIDIIEEKLPTLAGDANMTEARKRYIKGADSQGFVDVERFLGVIQKTINKMAIASGDNVDGAQMNLDEAFGKMSGLKYVGTSSSWDDVLKAKIDIFLDMSDKDSQMSRVYSNCSNVTNTSVSLSPKEVIGYQWGSCFDLSYYWEEIKKQQELTFKDNSDGGMSEQVAQMEKAMGLSIEKDILPAFGKEFGGFLTDIEAGMIPIPKLALFVEAADKGKVEKIMSVLLERSPMPLQNEKHSGVEINYIPLPMGEMLQPSYAFVGKYLMIAISKSMIKEAIDMNKDNSNSFAKSSGMSSLQFKSGDGNVGENYFQVAKFLEKINGVIEWGFNQAQKRSSNTQSLKAGSQKMLTNVKKQTVALEDELSKKKDLSVDLKIELSKLTPEGTDAKAKLKERENLLKNIDDIKADIEANKEKIKDVQEIIKAYGSEGDSGQNRQVLDEVVYPLLKAFKSIKAMGSKAYKNGNVLESHMHIDVK